MNASQRRIGRSLWVGIGAAILLSGCATVTGWYDGMTGWVGGVFSSGVKVTLSGSEEVPPVTTSAKGSGTITVKDDGSISGSITTSGVAAFAAHIHMAERRTMNGGIIVPLTKTSDNVWSVPAGAKLNQAQMAAFKAGLLYVNVHSAAYKGGEIRGQIKP
ncbi:MAG TPA: CHRD domain-containing protein [Burkholderiales bacterium]|nr:CHRD domain-containing protein [Burkholderiales bacterium]